MIVITSGLGSFEFGNTGMSSLGKGSKNYSIPIVKFKSPKFFTEPMTGYAKGSLSWDVSLKSTHKYNIELSGTLNFYDYKHGSFLMKRSCRGEGTLSEAKGKLIVSNGSIRKDSDFSFGMGNLEINCFESAAVVHHYTFPLFEGWRYIE